MPFSRPLLIALVAAVLAVPALAPAQAQADSEARVIVRFKPQADSVRAKALSARATRGEARDVAQTRATALGLRTGHALRAGISLDERTHVLMSSGLTGAQLAKRLAADPEVELVAVDQRRKHLAVPNDTWFGGATPAPTTFTGQYFDTSNPPKLRDAYSRPVDQWYLKAPSGVISGGSASGEVVSSINAPAAWDLVTGGTSVVVAVLDTGVRPDHPDLSGQFVGGYDMIGFGSPGTLSTAIANDGGGHDADPADPGDWVSDDDRTNKDSPVYSACKGEPLSTNSSWHGTRVSGLIAAKANNGLGIAGVGFGLLKILPVRVLGKCGGWDSDIVAGMKWAAGIAVPGLPANPNKAKVINMSLGGDGKCETSGTGGLYRDTITQVTAAGVSIVVAAGNSEGQAVGLPGNCPGVITVAALRHVGTKVGFSSIGPEVSIAAPGGNCINTLNNQPCLYPMVSTTNGGTTSPILNDESYTGSRASVGTSFSAPVVSGIVGLMASVRPGLTPAEALNILKSTARPFPASGGTAGISSCTAPGSSVQDECYCTTTTCGAGMVDAFAAVKAAQALNGATLTITQNPASGLAAGQTLTLSLATTGLSSGRTVASTAWSIVNGGGIVTTFATGANTATATLTPSAAGSFTVQVEMTDNLGLVYTQTATVTVVAAPVVAPPSSNGGGGGGGAVSAVWLAGLLLAAFSLRTRPTRQPLRCRP